MVLPEDLQFIIETVEDEIKMGELGENETWSSKEEILTEVEAHNSYFSAQFSTIQSLDDRKSLLILVIRCHPAIKRRFVNATITWRVAIANMSRASSQGKKPKITHLAPESSVGGWTEEWSKLVWGVAVPVQVGLMGSSIGVQPSRNRETEKITNYAMTIVGTKRNVGSRCVWTIEENSSSKRGIPSHFQVAIVVEHEGPFETELDVKAELGGGLWPTFLKAKKEGDLRRTIDVESWRCGEVVWAEEGWEKYMKEMTGRVEGSSVEFS